MFFISFHISEWSVPIVAIDQLKSWTDKKKGWLVRRVPNVEKKSEMEKARKERSRSSSKAESQFSGVSQACPVPTSAQNYGLPILW